MRTVGVSPKVLGAMAGAIVSYLLIQEVVDFPAWADLALNVVAVGLGAVALGPGQVVSEKVAKRRRGESGQVGDPVRVLLWLLVAVVVVVLIVALLRHV